MKVIGIVVEYNPFHNGHIYQIKKVKEMFPESIIIVALSGYFTERGEISIIDKWDKAFLALKYNVDIVLEIPFIFSNQSADTFSYASIKMLNEFNIDTLVFGYEELEKESLIKIAKTQIENKDFDILVKEYLNKGYNYPTSVGKSIYDLTNINIIKSNDLLAVSYIKEIIKNNYNIDILPIKRTNNYLDIESSNNIVSACNIRNKLNNKENISKYVPKETLNYIKDIDYSFIFNLLKYKIISEKDNLEEYHLVTEGINNRIYKSILNSQNMQEFINNIKSKRVTTNKINRILINILVGFTKKEAKKYKSVQYIRILGLSKNGRIYYKKIKDKTKLPIYVKFEKNDILDIEYKVSLIYSIITKENTNETKRHTILM